MDYDDPHLLTALSSLEELAETYTDIFLTSHKKIVKDFVVKKLLVVDRVSWGRFSRQVKLHVSYLWPISGTVGVPGG